MSTVLLECRTMTGHLTVTENSVMFRRFAPMAPTDTVMRSAITGVDVKKLGFTSLQIRIHRMGGGDLVIPTIGKKDGEALLALIQ